MQLFVLLVNKIKKGKEKEIRNILRVGKAASLSIRKSNLEHADSTIVTPNIQIVSVVIG